MRTGITTVGPINSQDYRVESKEQNGSKEKARLELGTLKNEQILTDGATRLHQQGRNKLGGRKKVPFLGITKLCLQLCSRYNKISGIPTGINLKRRKLYLSSILEV